MLLKRDLAQLEFKDACMTKYDITVLSPLFSTSPGSSKLCGLL